MDKYQEAYRKKHPDTQANGTPHAVAERRKYEKYSMTPKGRAAVMLNNARRRAKKHGVQCTLTQDWIQEKLEAGVCEYTGIPFVWMINHGRGHRENSFAPSLDRIDQSGDYIPSNVRMCVWIYNRARGAFPDEDLVILVEALARKLL